MRNYKGITLVALVVTIIVLLILVGVTLNIVLDQDGIINKTKQATEDYENSQEIEEELLGQAEDYLETKTVPIPEGYVASSVLGENTVAEGLVIYEGEEAVTDENHEQALLSRNQYVWIPVKDINEMVMCSSNTAESQCNLILEGNTLKCTIHEDTATDLVGRLYTGLNYDEGNGIRSYRMDFLRRDQTYDAINSERREPAIVASDNYNYHGLENAELFLEQLKSDFRIMATSVAKNKGFYISRYEIGENGESKKGQTVLNNGSSSGNMWYGLYNACRDLEKRQQMIWGCQYDQVIKFVGDEAQIGHSERNLTTTQAISGENSLDKMKNIYDLEGNFYEWTQEAESEDGRTSRGNYYGNTLNSYYSAASNRNNSNGPTHASYYGSTRVVLY